MTFLARGGDPTRACGQCHEYVSHAQARMRSRCVCGGTLHACGCAIGGAHTCATDDDETPERAVCGVCGEAIRHVVESNWHGWLDVDGDQLSYVPSLHDHQPERNPR